MNEQAIKLVEKIIKRYRIDYDACPHPGCGCIDCLANETLIILRKPVCKTCGGSGEIEYPEAKQAWDIPDAPIPMGPCTDCKQSEAGAFTKRFRDFIKLSEEHLSKSKIGRLRIYGREACTRLDQLEYDLQTLEAYRNQNIKQHNRIQELETDTKAQAEEIERLKEALGKYGSHLRCCDSWKKERNTMGMGLTRRKCDCGFEQALQGQKPPEDC